jgi:hypothetical protein
LEGASKTPIGGWIEDGMAIMAGEFGFGVEGVEMGLQLDMLARSISSRAYCCWDRNRPCGNGEDHLDRSCQTLGGVSR